MESTFQKYRKPFSVVAVAAGVFFLGTTQSRWETGTEAISFTLFLIGMVLVGIASLGRMWCSLYIAGYKDNRLVTKGPYSISRNPLYFFSLLGVIGIGCCTETFTFPIVFTILFGLYYPLIIKGEAQRLKQLFGGEFEDYVQKVPAFFPKISLLDEPQNYHVIPATYRKHIFSALWFIWLTGILEFIEGVREIGWITPLLSVY